MRPNAAVIVRWTDASGPMEAIYGPELPWEVRALVLTMGNDDWGEIWIKNPEEPEFLWCSAKPEHRLAARAAIGQLVAVG